MCKKGFTLIECCVYLLGVGLISLLCAQWIARTTHLFFSQKNNYLSLVIASDYMQASLATMQGEPKVVTPKEIVARHENKDMGWSLEKGKLIRKDGTYNMRTKKWDTYVNTVVASDIKGVSFKLNQGKRKQLLFTIRGNGAVVEQVITMRNGAL